MTIDFLSGKVATATPIGYMAGFYIDTSTLGNATDGNPDTFIGNPGAVAGDAYLVNKFHEDAAYLEWDIGSVQKINQIRWKQYFRVSPVGPGVMRLKVSSDGSTWTSIHDVGGDETDVTLDINQNVRFVRIVVFGIGPSAFELLGKTYLLQAISYPDIKIISVEPISVGLGENFSVTITAENRGGDGMATIGYYFGGFESLTDKFFSAGEIITWTCNWIHNPLSENLNINVYGYYTKDYNPVFTDNVTHTIEYIPTEGKAEFFNYYPPSEAYANDTVAFPIYINNIGLDDTIFCQIVDENENQLFIERKFVLGGNGERFDVNFTMPNRKITITANIGHEI